MNLKSWLLTIITFTAVALTAALGLWQLDRADQKRAMATRLAQQSVKPAITTEQLPDIALNPTPFLEQPVLLRGRWLPQYTVALDNRQMNQRVGFYLVMAMELALPGAPVILVQRGWAPRNSAQRDALPPLTTASGEVTVRGRITQRLSQAYSLGGDAPGAIRQNLEITAYAHEISRPLLPLAVIQIDDESHPVMDGLQRNWPAIDLGIEKHLGYAFQWFLLTGLLVGLYFWLGVIAPRRKRKATTHLAETTPQQ